MKDSSQHPVEMAEEQQAANQWQDNCMGQCHYSDAVTPTPDITVGGERPDTPYNDQYVEGAWSIANGTAAIAGVGTSAVSSLLDATSSAENSGITILGYSEDVRDYNGVNVNSLVDQPNWSWEGMNVPFLDDAMARGDTFVYVSDHTKFDERVFNREVQYLVEKGYKKIIDMFHPR